MRKNTLQLILAATLLVAFCLILSYFISNQKEETEQKVEEFDPYERPDEITSKEEMEINERNRINSLHSVGQNKSTAIKSTYANGEVNGTWEQYQFLMDGNYGHGFRVDGSIYDRFNDVIYAISYAGHIWKINRTDKDVTKTTWELINHKENFKTSYIEGLNKEDGSFRMIRSSDNKMQYSDDEGQTWNNATGVYFENSTYNGIISNYNNKNRIFVVGKVNSSSFKAYVSSNNGVSYSALSLSLSPNTYELKILKPCNSESVFVLARNKSTSKLSIYECAPNDDDFTLIASPTQAINGLNRVLGTFNEDKYHFYIAGEKTHIYYSNDKGATWQIKSSNNDGDGDIYPRTVHPTKPNVIFRGYLDVNMSTNYGASFSNYSHLLGWDVHHMKMYQKKDSSYFHFVGKDFGCYISDTPDVKTSYQQLNYTSPIQMCYDASHSPEFESSFTGMQDRGTRGFRSNSIQAFTYDVRSTDGLRVTVANNGESVWTWMYFGTIYHKSNFAARNSVRTSIDWTSNWWAAPMIPSPNIKEDAVYVASGEKLTKFTYNPASDKIIKTSHYYNFYKESGQKITGFGYSSINKDKWYVAVKDGQFFYSNDGGQTFSKASFTGNKPKANDQYYNYNKNQHVIKSSRHDENKVFYAGVGNYFLISDDGGKTFSNHNSGLGIYRIRDFDLSADEKFVFAACAKGGIWVYSVESDRWYVMNDEPIPYVDFTDVQFNEKENTVYFASYGNGVMKFKLDGDDPSVSSPGELTAQKISKESIQLNWADNSNNETGFMIERSIDGEFKKIATVAANTTKYVDDQIVEADLFTYRVKAINNEIESFYSNYSLVETSDEGVLKEKWELVYTDSEETVSTYPGYAKRAFDNDEGTLWHTQWYNINPKPAHPHQIVIDMNDTLDLYGFTYLPRQDGSWNGTIKDFEFYTSMDKTNWIKATSGTWTKTTDEKEELFSSSKQARYIKLLALSEVNGTAFTSCAELSVITELTEPKSPHKPQIVQAGRLSDTEIELIWLDLSDDEDGFQVELLDGVQFKVLKKTGENITSYKISNASLNSTYELRIAAFNDIGLSIYSDTVTINAQTVRVKKNLEMEDEKLVIFPNPFTHSLTINFNEGNQYKVWKLYSTDGKLVKNGPIEKGLTQKDLNLSDLNKGAYILELKGELKRETKRIIKSK